MKYIRPYGRSEVKGENALRRKRVLDPNKKPEEPNLPGRHARENNELKWEPPEYLKLWHGDPEFLISQWISIVDKVLSKPQKEPKGKASEKLSAECLKRRRELGAYVWEQFKEEYNIENIPDKKGVSLKDIWDRKINAEQKKPPKQVEGRLYKDFVKAPFKPAKCFYEIRRHLLCKAIGAGKRKGFVAHQASSIEKNVLKIQDRPQDDYEEKDFEIYAGVISQIREKILNLIKEEEKSSRNPSEKRPPRGSSAKGASIPASGKFLGNRSSRDRDKNIERPKLPVRLDHEAMGLLSGFLKERLYPEKSRYQAELKSLNEGGIPSKELRIHQDVKELYKALLGNRKLTRKDRNDKIERNLPQDFKGLCRLITQRKRNRDLNHLIRLGKIIHYTAAKKREDDAKVSFMDSFPNKDEVVNSPYWDTEHQIAIKQSEAFVRVFRTAISFAARTLEDWSFPEPCDSDILRGEGKQKQIEKSFEKKDFDRKAPLLLGGELGYLGLENKAGKIALLVNLQGYLLNLRNASFHFKGLDAFIENLEKDAFDQATNGNDKHSEESTLDAGSVLKKLYERDCQERGKRICKIMEGSHFHYYFSRDFMQDFYDRIRKSAPSVLPISSFKHVLERAKNAWRIKGFELSLPSRPTSAEMEEAEPGRGGNWKVAQYTCLKMLYDGPFKEWLEENGNLERIKPFMDRAEKRATAEAKRMNAKEPKEERWIVSRAARLILLEEELRGKNFLEGFLSHLTAETASEMRIQESYEPNHETARDQAKYIENLKKDVIAQAFEAYLKESFLEEFNLLVEADRQSKEHEGAANSFPNLTGETEVPSDAEGWEYEFYGFLRLLPPSISNDLYHQILKYSIVIGKGGRGQSPEEKRRLQKLLSLFVLYHDMRSTFGKGEYDLEELDFAKGYFEPEALYRKVFKTGSADRSAAITSVMRGLREMMRFGKNPTLEKIFENNKITSAEVQDWEKRQPRMAGLQKKLKALHEEWEDKKDLSSEKRKAYEEVLKEVSEYWHLNAHATLQDHARLFRLTMRILGRLLDYSGLWERDLYFSILALLYREGIDIKSLGEGSEDGGKSDEAGENSREKSFEGLIEDGRIVAAILFLEKKGNSQEKDLIQSLKGYMGLDENKEGKRFEGSEKKGMPEVRIRNDFAHLNMLRPKRDESDFNLDLTREVNKARQLMSYDRKLKNAVSKSIIEIMEREGLHIKWKIENHALSKPVIEAKEILHLKKSKKDKSGSIKERTFDDKYLKMARELFDQKARQG